MEERLLYGFVGSVLIAGIAYIKRSLSISGAIAAVVLGTALYALGDIKWYGLLIAFLSRQAGCRTAKSRKSGKWRSCLPKQACATGSRWRLMEAWA